MFESNDNYDRNVNTFSSEGRLFQVEYALRAVEDGWTTVGIQTKEGVVLAAEKRVKNRLQVSSSIEKISKIEDHVICTHSGLLSDGRSLLDHARVEAANHWFVYDEQMPVHSIATAVSSLALSFADSKKKDDKEKRKISRPFGCALLIAGIDWDGSSRLFMTDPSGNFSRFKASCIGAGGESGMVTLTENYKEDMTLDQAILLAAKVIKENMEQRINKENIEVSYISNKDKKIIKYNTEQIEDLIKIIPNIMQR